jgi:cytidylate kinase
LPAVVTVAALYGAGGSLIGRRVAERLGVRFLDRPTPNALAGPAEEPRRRRDRIFDALGRASPPTGASGHAERLDLDDRDVHRETEAFLAGACAGGGVVVGRGGAVVLASVPGVLHVYLGGDRDRRIDRIMEIEGRDRSTATRDVDAHDRARRDYVRSAYGVDGDEPSLYHLMVDAVSLGPDVCVDLIVAASESLARRTGVSAGA